MFKKYLSLSRTVHLLCAGALINRAGALLLPFLALYLRESLGLGVGFATMAMGVFGAGALVASLIGGHLADLIGRKTVMLISLFGGAGVLVVFRYLSVPWMILAAILAFALLSEMYRPAASAMVADVTEPEERAHAFGLMYVAINLGFAVAASVGGILAEVSFHWLFWGDALTAAAFGLLIALWIGETMPRRGRHAAIKEPGITPTEDGGATLAAAARHILTDGVFLAFCGGTFVLAVMFMQSFTAFPIYLADRGIGPRTYGMIMSLNGVLIVCLQLPITSLVTRFHRGWVLALSAAITGAGFAVFGVATAPWHFALGVAVWTAGEMMGSPLSSAIVSDLAPRRFRGRYMGVFSMSFSSSMMVGSPLGGLILRDLGGGYLWVICALLGLASALVFALLRNRLLPPAKKA